MQTIIDKLNTLNQDVQALKTKLGPLSEKYNNDADKETLQLVFAEKASIKDLTDLEDYAHQWRLVLHNFSRLVNESPAPAQIQSIQKGSTVIVINAPVATILALAFVVEKLIALYEKLLKLRKLSLEIQNLKLNNKKLTNELKNSEKQTIEEQVEQIVKALYQKYEKKITGNDKQEIKNQLNSSVKNVYNFVVNGGRVEVNNYEPNEADKDAPNLQFEPKYNQIQKMIKSVGNVQLLEMLKKQDSEKSKKKQAK